ncbi:MAG: hypothetical protein WKG00_05545 [Polyangiaceae bacterium]
MAGLELPIRAIRGRRPAFTDRQQSRLSDGSRKVTAINEIIGIDRETSEIEMRPIFELSAPVQARRARWRAFRATATCRRFDAFIVMGLVNRGEPYLKPLHTLDALRWGSLGVIGLRCSWHVGDHGDETGLPYRYWARYCGCSSGRCARCSSSRRAGSSRRPARVLPHHRRELALEVPGWYGASSS